MKIIFILTLITSTFCFSGEKQKVFGIEYDQVWFVELSPAYRFEKDSRLFDRKGEVIEKHIRGVIEVEPKKVNPLFSQKAYFNEGLAAIKLNLYSLVFYKDNKFSFALAVHPDMRLRWTPGPWSGDAVLDEFAYFQIIDWLKTNIKKAKVLDKNKFIMPKELAE